MNCLLKYKLAQSIQLQKLGEEEYVNIFYVEKTFRKLYGLSPLATQYSFYPFCMLCPFGDFSAFLEIGPIILGAQRIFLFNNRFSFFIGKTFSTLLKPSCGIRREMKNNHPRRPEGREQIQQRPFWHLLYHHGAQEEALTRFSTSACFKRRLIAGGLSRLLTIPRRFINIFDPISAGTVRSMPPRTQPNRITILQVILFLSPTQFQTFKCIFHV